MTSHSIILNVTLLLTINSVISAQRLSCVSLNGYGQCYNYKERDFDLCLSCKIENTNLLKGGAVTIPNYSLRSNVKQIYFEGGTVDFLPMTEISMAFPNLHCLYFNGTITKTISDGFFQNISRKDLKEFRFEFSKTSVEIDANAFRSVKNLHMVLISNNNDLSIDSLAFSGLIYLKELDLNSNKLEIVQQLWFTDLRELEHLFVAKNKIRKLENGVFMNLRKLKVLSLHTNKLKFLQFSLFASNTNLKELYLQSNQIMEIQAGTFLKLTQLIELSLLGNICVDQTFEDLPAVEIEKELKECTSSKQNEKPKESSIEEEVDYCQIPVIENGKIFVEKVEQRPKSNYTNWKPVEIQCNKDFSLVVIGDVLYGNGIFCNKGRWENHFPSCKKLCNINEVYGLTVKTFCHRDSVTISCSSNILPGTVATVSCKQGYKTAIHENPSKEYLCLDSGKWDDVVFRCQPQCGLLPSTATKLIYGGEDTNITNVPWMAAIYRNNDHICGGTIISERIVLSAAHCFTNDYFTKVTLFPKTIFKVGVGKYHRDIDQAEDIAPQILNVDEIIIPDNYDGKNGFLEADIAVTIVKGFITYQLHIAPACLEFRQFLNDKIIKNGTYGWVAGWGLIKSNGLSSKILQKVQLPIVDYYTCKAKAPGSYNNFVTLDKLCAGYIQNNIAVCPGDSGGGFVIPIVKGEKTFHYLEGIVSNSKQNIGGCNTEFYAMFTNVQEYSQFIKSAQVKYTTI